LQEHLIASRIGIFFQKGLYPGCCRAMAITHCTTKNAKSTKAAGARNDKEFPVNTGEIQGAGSREQQFLNP